jgi:hypothetical protein
MSAFAGGPKSRSPVIMSVGASISGSSRRLSGAGELGIEELESLDVRRLLTEDGAQPLTPSAPEVEPQLEHPQPHPLFASS